MGQIRYFKVNLEKDDIILTAICELIKTVHLTKNTYEYVFEDMITATRFSSVDNFEEITIYKALELLKNITGIKLKDYASKIKLITNEDLKIEEPEKQKIF